MQMRPLTNLPHVYCRDFKSIILALLWESNEHLLSVAEVRATTLHRLDPGCLCLLRFAGHGH
jgi:hypothetical protein